MDRWVTSLCPTHNLLKPTGLYRRTGQPSILDSIPGKGALSQNDVSWVRFSSSNAATCITNPGWPTFYRKMTTDTTTNCILIMLPCTVSIKLYTTYREQTGQYRSQSLQSNNQLNCSCLLMIYFCYITTMSRMWNCISLGKLWVDSDENLYIERWGNLGVWDDFWEINPGMYTSAAKLLVQICCQPAKVWSDKWLVIPCVNSVCHFLNYSSASTSFYLSYARHTFF